MKHREKRALFFHLKLLLLPVLLLIYGFTAYVPVKTSALQDGEGSLERAKISNMKLHRVVKLRRNNAAALKKAKYGRANWLSAILAKKKSETVFQKLERLALDRSLRIVKGKMNFQKYPGESPLTKEIEFQMIHLNVSGKYPRVRDFLQQIEENFPAMMISRVSLKSVAGTGRVKLDLKLRGLVRNG